MPTAKPRITITLDENKHRLLSKLSELQGVSMSSIVVDFLDSVVPVLERVAVVLQNAKDAPQSVKDELRKSAEQAENDFLPHAADVMGQLDLLVTMAATGSQPKAAPVAASPSKAAKKAGPPSSNRGVRIPPSKSRKPSTGAASKAFGKGVKK